MTGDGRGVLYEFGDFAIDVNRRLLLSRPADCPINLPTAAFDILLVLVRRAGALVEKSVLLKTVWPNVHVHENNLSQSISALRAALHDRASSPRFIATVPGRGYRFVADVTVLAAWCGAPSIAVLPFKPLRADMQNQALQLGMADALIGRLGALHNVDVKPLSSVIRFGALDQDPIAAGRELTADIVIDGAIQIYSERLRVSVRLINVANGRQVWAESFDETPETLFAVQDVVTERVATALSKELSASDRQQFRRHSTSDVRAYRSYLVGWAALMRPTAESLQVALRALEEAVAFDPKFALAYTRIAHCYTLFSVFNLERHSDALPKAIAAAERALELDPELAEAHAQLGHARGLLYQEYSAAKRGLARALDLNPRLAVAHHMSGLWLLAEGQFDEALRAMRHAQALEPLAVIFSANIGMVYYYARRYDEAVAQLQATLAMDPALDHARSLLGRTYLRLGDTTRALAEFKRRRGTSMGSAADLVAAYAQAGRREDALDALQRIRDTRSGGYSSGYELATAYAAVGDIDGALDALRHATQLPFVDLDPAIDILRTDPRFQTIVAGLRWKER